jgi:inner membrane protein
MARFPLLGKVIALTAIVLLLLLALGQVSGVVAERQGRLQEAERSVAASLAGDQQLIGPVLQRHCDETWIEVVGEGKDLKRIAQRREFELVAAPKQLDIDANATLEPRYRGLFKVNGYVLKADLAAQWATLDALQPRAAHAGSQLRCEEPIVIVALGDARGIRVAQVRMEGAALDVLPGTHRGKLPHGFHARMPARIFEAGVPWSTQIRVELVGTRSLSIAPVGEQSQVRLRSSWPHPSFQGRFLPVERDVGDQGFDARWRISALASSAPRSVLADTAEIESFGVDFVDPVNTYVLSDRATKYGLLFVVLTFIAVALVELLRRVRVHPLQYLLVGSALTVFFLLLISLSEHVSFAWAYAAASLACTALLAFYASHILGGVRAGGLFGALVAVLYGALYLLLQLEQTSLVLGSLLLFGVLAAVMVLTRRLDWYGLVDQLRARPQAQAR